MEMRAIEQSDRKKVDEFITQRWFSLQMVVHGKSIDLGKAKGLCAIDGDKIVGLVTFRVQGAEMEILSLDSAREGEGIGTTLLEGAVSVARASGLARVMLVTTNDNVSALCFYQRRGFDMVRIHRNALEAARRIKPEIPLIGENGIPIRHEIELEMVLR